MQIPWRDIKEDPPPPGGARIVAIDANPIIGTGIIAGPAGLTVRENYVTHWCWPHEIPIPPTVPPVRV